MKYHIETTPIWDAFEKNCECALCEIEKILSAKLVERYLNEAVMDSIYRENVNKNGFCAEHFRALYASKNKHGLALQIATRLKTLEKLFAQGVTNKKHAKKLAELLKNENTTCVICTQIEKDMVRYAFTLSQMFENEKVFESKFLECKGFCQKHYALLLENNTSSKEFLRALANRQKEEMNRLALELDWFCDKFDYRNKDKDWGTSKDALPRAILKLKGDILPEQSS